MPFPEIVWRESDLLYKNEENILSVLPTLSWTGVAPQFFLTNKFSSFDDDKWEAATLPGSGVQFTHTFTTTGQEFGWRIVFVRDQTTITGMEFEGGSGMTGTGKITKQGRLIVLERSFSSSPTRTIPNQLKLGEGSTAASDTDTDLVTSRPIHNEEVVDGMESAASWTPNLTNTTTDNTTTFFRGTQTINLNKIDATSVTCKMTKAVTSLNFTSKRLFGFFRVSTSLLALLAASGSVKIRYGSDSSNYYTWNVNAASITANSFFRFDKSAAEATSTTGSPSLTAMDYMEVEFETAAAGSTSAAGDFIVEEFFIYDTDDLDKPLETGYPALNTTTVTVELRGRINTVQANGFLFTEAGYGNLDSPTRQLFSRFTFDDLSKGLNDEFIFSHLIDVVQGQ